MPSLRCPRCTNVVSVAPGETPTCGRCGFGVAVDVPTEASVAPVADYVAPAAPAAQAAPRGRSRLAVVAVVAVLLVGAALGAAVLFGGRDAKILGGTTTEAELKSALASIRDGSVARDDGGSDTAFGMVGTISGSPDGSGGSGGEMTVNVRALFDRPNEAYEMSYEGGGGGVTVDIAVKQKGHKINYVQGDQVFEGRDEDPSTLPEFGDLQDMSGGPGEGPLADLFGSGAIDRQEATTFKGKAATKFYIHDPNGTTDERGEIIVYDGTTRVAWMKMMSEGMTAEFEMLYGKEVKISVQDSDRRASFILGDQPFGTGPGFDGQCEYSPDSSQESKHCTIPPGHVQEVKLGEVELRVTKATYESGPSGGESVTSMKLDEGSKTENGVTLHYVDNDGDGLVSEGDAYSYDVAMSDGQSFHQMTFYDLWADAPAGGPGFPMPGFDLVLLMASVGLAAMLLVRRRQD